MNTGTQSFSLARTGDLPLAFEGECLAKATSKRTEGPGQNRWHDLTLYRTAGARYVLCVCYRSQWRDEDDLQWVRSADTPAGVRDALRAYQPVPDGAGFPDGEAFRDKQARMENDLRRRFAVAVTELFDGLDGFAEGVE
jgi:hypothetical protein